MGISLLFKNKCLLLLQGKKPTFSNGICLHNIQFSQSCPISFCLWLMLGGVLTRTEFRGTCFPVSSHKMSLPQKETCNPQRSPKRVPLPPGTWGPQPSVAAAHPPLQSPSELPPAPRAEPLPAAHRTCRDCRAWGLPQSFPGEPNRLLQKLNYKRNHCVNGSPKDNFKNNNNYSHKTLYLESTLYFSLCFFAPSLFGFSH